MRLAAALASRPSPPSVIARPPATSPTSVVNRESAASTGTRPASQPSIADNNLSPSKSDSPVASVESSGFDEAAESAFLAEARDRGEVTKPRAESAVDAVDEIDSKPLPALDDLVAKIPADVREALEDLFRARFVAVKRVPKKALKK
jgi:hypothetical protein